jgi:hypothetical protein
LETWLRKQPREISVAFAARAALRVLPILHDARNVRVDFRGNFFAGIVLRVFRATGVAWAAAKYPDRATGLHHAVSSAVSSSAAAIDATAVFSGSYASPNAVTSAVYAAVDAASSAAVSYGSYASPNAAASADYAAASYATYAATRGADDIAIWSAVSIDATRVEEGATASVIARSPLWPQGQPDWLQSLWQEMKAALLAENQDWQVWTIWYDDRLAGHVRDEERELAYVRIEEALWSQGPAIVNAEIKRRIEELEFPPRVVEVSASGMAGSSGRASLSVAEPAISAVPVDNPPIAGAAAQHHSEVLAAWQSADAALQTPHPRRPYVPDVLFNPVALGAGGTPPAPIEAIPEQEPLATRFGVNSHGLIDVVPDPPAHGIADALQREFYEETRIKAQALVELGPNLLGALNDPANRFRVELKDPIEDISITSLWSRGNTLRIRLRAHDLSMSNAEPDPRAYLP